MSDKGFKNQKIRNDIQKEFTSSEAKLALGILKLIEESDGKPDPAKVKKLADECFKEAEAE